MEGLLSTGPTPSSLLIISNLLKVDNFVGPHLHQTVVPTVVLI